MVDLQILATFKWLHLVGVVLLMFAFGALVFRSASGSEARPFSERFLSIAHGLGMLLAAIGGFGMLRYIGVTHGNWPTWVSIKFLIWLAMGLMIAPIQRAPHRSATWWWLILLLAMCAAFLGVTHPPVP